CKLLPKQHLVVQDNGGGSASSAAKSSPAPMSQKQPTTDSFVKDEYENYYIEQNKTTMVPFKTMLMPYDQDRTNLFGVMSQIVSGACNFVVTHRVKKDQLFVTATLLPPTVRADATIIPR
ncbi:PAAR domain-containing protein, partial [Acinetobacter baumannii]